MRCDLLQADSPPAPQPCPHRTCRTQPSEQPCIVPHTRHRIHIYIPAEHGSPHLWHTNERAAVVGAQAHHLFIPLIAHLRQERRGWCIVTAARLDGATVSATGADWEAAGLHGRAAGPRTRAACAGLHTQCSQPQQAERFRGHRVSCPQPLCWFMHYCLISRPARSPPAGAWLRPAPAAAQSQTASSCASRRVWPQLHGAAGSTAAHW